MRGCSLQIWGWLALGFLTSIRAPLHADTPAGPPKTLKEAVVRDTGRLAYGMYMGGKKAGYMIEEVKLGMLNGQEVAVLSTELKMAIIFQGEKNTITSQGQSYFSLTEPGYLLAFDETTKEDKQTTKKNVTTRDDGTMLFTKTVGKRVSERKIARPKETLREHLKLEEWLKGERKAGEQFENWTTDWDEDEINNKEVVTFQERKSIAWGGVATEIVLATVKTRGLVFNAQMRTDGKLLTGQIGGLIDLRLEKESVAKQLNAEPVDMLAASAIIIERDLGPGEKVDALTLEVTGLGDLALPESPRQKLRSENGKQILELKRDFRHEQAEPLNEADRKKYLEATPSMQVADETIKKQVATIIGDETDPLKKADLLRKWVYKRLRKTMASNADNALTVLDNKAGDCTEHSLLFTTLARAAGVPSRQVGGVAYIFAGKPLFGWHAWSEIHDGHQWVSVDPTWNELYVDGTHIKFSEGTSDLSWVGVIGKLKFKVVDVKTR
jgi:hypothetical protein